MRNNVESQHHQRICGFRQAAKTLLGDKKGLELSLTVIVLIILTIIIFIGGIALVWKLFAGAEEIKGGIELQTKQQIESLLREGNELVAIPVNTKQAALGSDATFGLGIRNIREQPKTFFIQLNLAGVYTQKGQALPHDGPAIERDWLGSFQTYEGISIAHDKYDIVPVTVRAMPRPDTPKGALVVFNACVCEDSPCGECTLQTPVYERIHQIFVEVK